MRHNRDHRRSKNLAPAQRLWAAVFRRPEGEAPPLDEEKVLAITDGLSASERSVLRLFFGFQGTPPFDRLSPDVSGQADRTPLSLTEIGQRLRRADGQLGVSRQRTTAILVTALRHLRHSSRRRAWEEAGKK